MEAECNAVAAGRKRKEEIMEPMLTKMLECFNRATAEARKLDDAVARHFTRIGSNNANSTVLQRNFSICGRCGDLTTLKELLGGARANNARGNTRNNQQARAPAKLIHCETCSLGLRLPAKGTPSPFTSPGTGTGTGQNEPAKCPICNYQIISIGQGEGYAGNGYQVCPKCFSDPPAEHGGASNSGEFRCFQCSHPTCAIASGSGGSNVEIRACPFCEATGAAGKVTLNKNSRGYILSCDNYRATRCEFSVWLPKEASTIEAMEESSAGNHNASANAISCAQCSSGNKMVRKLKFKWKAGSVPPGFGREYVACVFCDQTLKTDFRVTIPQLNQVQTRTRQRNNNRSNSNGNGNCNGNGNGTGNRNRAINNTATAANTNARSSRNNGRSRERNVGGGGERGGGGNSASNSGANNLDGIICFRCNQAGHYASSCPNTNR
eukprot:scaffold3087_cov288-Chaetoceros_neogracile.AAC.8